MSLLRQAIVLTIFSCLMHIAHGQDNRGVTAIDTSTLYSDVDQIIHQAIRDHVFPGAQVVVNYKGQTVFNRAYGYHTYDSLTSVKIDDIWDIASITKVAAVTTALMKLVGEGRFDLDATVADYFPEFGKTNKSDITWREILAHNAGLYPWIPYWENTIRKNGKYKCHTFKDHYSRRYPIEITNSLYLHRKYKKHIYKAIANSPLNSDPGYVYSGLAFYLLPEIIERIVGESFEEYLKSQIYHPIGAYDITYNPLEHYPIERIVPTEWDSLFRKTLIHGHVHDEGAAMMGGVSGNAGLFATGKDLAALGQLFLDQGLYQGDTIISPAAIREFTRCQYCDQGNRRGLGFDKPPWQADPMAESVTICPKASPDSYGHSGFTGTLLWVDPDEDLVYVFLSNRVYPTRKNTLINTLKIRPAVHCAIYNSIKPPERPHWDVF